ncbi:MAG: extracellular solute-binding protein [Eubacteriales bacterium]|nr:extracellular solute-binding protein [Eubacteriales bacterium]
MKKTLALALVLCIVLAFAAPAFADAEPTEIEYWTFQALHVDFYKTMAEKWNELNPDRPITIKETVLDYEDMHSKLGIALQSGEGAPDLVDIEINKFANFLQGDIQLLPLNEELAPELDNIVKARVEIYSKDDNYYGICFHIGAAVIFYNAKMCEEAGIDYQNIKTWDDYYEAGKKFKEAFPDKYWASVETGDVWHVWPLIVQAGGDFTTADGEPNLDSPEVAKALEYNRKMLDEGIACVAPGGGHHQEEFYGYMNDGNICSIVMPMWYLDRFTNYMPDLKGQMAVWTLPVWDENSPKSVGQGGTGTAVTNQADDPQLTKDFLVYAKTSRDGAIVAWNDLGFDPIRVEALDLPEVKDAENVFTEYYVTRPIDVLMMVKDDIAGHNNNSVMPATLDTAKANVFTRAYTEENVNIPEMLAEEQANILY